MARRHPTNLLFLFLAPWSLSPLALLQLPAIVVALAAGGFEVEQEVLHVEPQLAQSVLNQVQDTPSPPGAVNDAAQDRLYRLPIFARQSLQGGRQFGQILGKLFGGAGGDSGKLRHGGGSRIGRVVDSSPRAEAVPGCRPPGRRYHKSNEIHHLGIQTAAWPSRHCRCVKATFGMEKYRK